jgi:hypothetical protein
MDEKQCKAFESRISKLSAPKLLEQLVRFERELQDLQSKRRITSRLYAEALATPVEPNSSPHVAPTSKAENKKRARTSTDSDDESAMSLSEILPSGRKRKAKVEAKAISKALKEAESSSTSSESAHERPSRSRKTTAKSLNDSDDDDIVPIKGTGRKLEDEAEEESETQDDDDADGEASVEVRKVRPRALRRQALKKQFMALRDQILKVFLDHPPRPPGDDLMVCEYSERQKEWVVPPDLQGELHDIHVRGRSGRQQQGFLLTIKGITFNTGLLDGVDIKTLMRTDPRDFVEIHKKVTELIQRAEGEKEVNS